MDQISRDEFLKLSDEDLMIEDVSIDYYEARAKLKCGLHVQWSGHDDEMYHGIEFAFAGSINNLFVMKNAPEKPLSKSDRMRLTVNYLSHCHNMKNSDESDPMRLQMEKLAKNIIDYTGGHFLFYELESYTMEIYEKAEEERERKIKEFFESHHDVIMSAIHNVAKKYADANSQPYDEKKQPDEA